MTSQKNILITISVWWRALWERGLVWVFKI